MGVISVPIMAGKPFSYAHAALSVKAPQWSYQNGEVGACTYMMIIVAFATKELCTQKLHSADCSPRNEHQPISRLATDFTRDSGQRDSQCSISQLSYKNKQAFV